MPENYRATRTHMPYSYHHEEINTFRMSKTRTGMLGGQRMRFGERGSEVV